MRKRNININENEIRTLFSCPTILKIDDYLVHLTEKMGIEFVNIISDEVIKNLYYSYCKTEERIFLLKKV